MEVAGIGVDWGGGAWEAVPQLEQRASGVDRGRGETWNWAGLWGNATVSVEGRGQGGAGLRGWLAGEESACGEATPWAGARRPGSVRPAGGSGGPTPWQSLPSVFPHSSTSPGLQVPPLSSRRRGPPRPRTGHCTTLLSQQGGSRGCSQEVWWPGDSVGLLSSGLGGVRVWGGVRGVLRISGAKCGVRVMGAWGRDWALCRWQNS